MSDAANKVVMPTSVDEVVYAGNLIKVPLFGHKIVHGRTGLILQGCKMHVMTHGLEKKSPKLPLGLEILSSYATLTTGSCKVAVVIQNTTNNWLNIPKGTTIKRIESANQIPPVSEAMAASKPQGEKVMTDEERQEALLNQLDLSGLDSWTLEVAAKAHNLLAEYHDIFSLEKNEIGHTKVAEHKIVFKDPDVAPFKECFYRIPPSQLDEVKEHLKLLLEAGAIHPSNSPWCNTVVLVQKKAGSLQFCINFRRFNALTRKDSHPLTHICEIQDSLVGSAYYSTFNLTSGLWQVPMAEESKQYTTFTLGSMGLFRCNRMPLGLCNAPATFQRLMHNCFGELNLTHYLIYFDDITIYSKSSKEHLQRIRVVFECLREHCLKLKLTKCDLFKIEIIYVTHHVSKEGVKPSMKNVTAIVECPSPKKYTDVCSFTGLVGHYRHFIKGFANIAAPLYDLTSVENKNKKSETVVLTAEALEAFKTLKEMCVQAPILSFSDFKKPFLLEADASGKGLGAVLSPKQHDGQYHPLAFASRVLTDTEQRFVVCTDNNPLTYVLSSAHLNALGIGGWLAWPTTTFPSNIKRGRTTLWPTTSAGWRIDSPQRRLRSMRTKFQ